MKQLKHNPRILDEAQEELLKASLEEFGDISGITHNIPTDEIITGNQRSKIIDIKKCKVEITNTFKKPDKYGTVAYGYIESEIGRMFYRQVEWDKSKCERACLAANKLGGIWDYIKLSDEFRIDELKKWGFHNNEIIHIKNITFEMHDWEVEKKKSSTRKKEKVVYLKIGRIRIGVPAAQFDKWLTKMDIEYNYKIKEIKDEIRKRLFS